jgi:hypothetical protein
MFSNILEILGDQYGFAGMVAGTISFVGFFAYIYLIFKGVNKPERVSWWIWTWVGVLLGESYFSSGSAQNTIWVPVTYIIGPLTIAIISIWKGQGGWSRTDKICLSLALISSVLRICTGPHLALGFNLFIDLVAVIPTIRAAIKNPDLEDFRPWLIFFVSSLINLLAVENWSSYSEIAYPLYMYLGNGAILTAAVGAKLRKRVYKESQ